MTTNQEIKILGRLAMQLNDHISSTSYKFMMYD